MTPSSHARHLEGFLVVKRLVFRGYRLGGWPFAAGRGGRRKKKRGDMQCELEGGKKEK